MGTPCGLFDAVALLLSWVEWEVLIDLFLLEEFGNRINVNEVDNRQYKFGLAAWNAFAVGEKFAAFVFDIFAELNEL